MTTKSNCNNQYHLRGSLGALDKNSKTGVPHPNLGFCLITYDFQAQYNLPTSGGSIIFHSKAFLKILCFVSLQYNSHNVIRRLLCYLFSPHPFLCLTLLYLFPYRFALPVASLSPFIPSLFYCSPLLMILLTCLSEALFQFPGSYRYSKLNTHLKTQRQNPCIKENMWKLSLWV